MLVFLDGERFEASLVEMPSSLRMEKGVPTHRMGVREPTEKAGKLLIRFGTDDEVPVIGHDAIRQDWQRFTLKCLIQHSLKRFVVFRLLEEC